LLGLAVPGNGVDALINMLVEAHLETRRLGDEAANLDRIIQGISDKTIRITTVYQTADGPINVQRPGEVATNPLTNPIGGGGAYIDPLDPYGMFGGSQTSIQQPSQLNRYPGFASGGFTGHSPASRIAGVVHGGEYVMDATTTRAIGVANLDAIRQGVRGYDTGGTVGTVTTLTNGQDVLSMIESNTYLGLMETRRIVGYLDTLVTDEQATLAAIQALQGEMQDVGRSVSSAASGGVPMGGSDVTSGNASWYGGRTYIGTPNDTVSMFAGGGIAYRPSVFGEAGPEAAVPLPDGRTIPVTIKGGGRTVNVHAHYHAAAGNPNPSPQSLMAMKDAIRQTVRSELGGL
jgi:hypothetical protein